MACVLLTNFSIGQNNNFVVCDTMLDSYYYCLESDLAYVNRREVPPGTKVDLAESASLSDSDYTKLRFLVCGAFTEERYNYLSQLGAHLNISIYTDGQGTIEGFKFYSANKPEILNFQDFTNIIHQLKGQSINIAPCCKNWPYWDYLYRFSFKKPYRTGWIDTWKKEKK